MRNINRIPIIIQLITKIWLKNPDLRLCQLLGNCFSKTDLYYTEDEKLEKRLKEFYQAED